MRIASPDGRPVQGYGGHRIEGHCPLDEACDSKVVLVPPIFNDIVQTLAREKGLVTWLSSFPPRSTLLGAMFTEPDADPDIRCTLLTAAGADFSLGVDVAVSCPAGPPAGTQP